MISNYTGVSGSRLAYYAARESERYQRTLIIVSSSRVAARLYEDMSFFVQSDITVLPEEEDLRLLYEARDMASTTRRIKGLRELTSGQKATVIAPISAAMRHLEPLERFKASSRRISIGDEVDIKELKEYLVQIGYEYSSVADAPGVFSSRGDIIDIYSPVNELPVRIEFFDTEVDAIRSFDPISQRSIENLSCADICQAVEFVPTKEEAEAALKKIVKEYDDRIEEIGNPEDGRTDRLMELRDRIKDMFENRTNQQIYSDYIDYFDIPHVHMWDYLAGDENTLVIVCDPARIEDSIPEYLDDGAYHEVYGVTDTIICTPFPEAIKGVERLDNLEHIRSHPIASYNGQMKLFTADVSKYLRMKYQVQIVSATIERSNRIREYLEDMQIYGNIRYVTGSLSAGMILDEEKLFVVTETDIFPGNHKKPLKRKHKSKASIDFSDLKSGDYVVHETHGIGRFEGIKTMEADGEVKDYLKIHYAGTAVLYIPTEQMDIVQRYIGSEGSAPKLSRLSGGDWRRARERAKKSIMEIAEDLVKLYAEREKAGGYAFSEDTVWQKEFEDDFPYTETEDQLRAIEEIKEDMQKALPMDRLLCGDVGYGKTEVAARAIFKCISEGKQAVLLAPTTLLVNQHYHNLMDRFQNFPFNIEMLSRFKSDEEQEKIVERLKKGTVDLVVGTHRLLSKDIMFKDLGLLVIDEEQRFGVKHKEKLKMLRKNIDVLTLSATPIPRTLNMSLTGIKNISVIEEPPEDRYPVQTYVTPEDEELIKLVIERELSRDGQVFVVYNRVRGINKVADMIRDLVPNARVAVGHGQMGESTLENVMIDFVEKKTDILVATTIIENGIDIPNANTMIVLDADRLGLSQLYQLRGRVGRSNRIAYAYLMYEPQKVLTEIARKRLTAIREFTEFGAGFKLAMRDLELRGAGNVLGEAQHGHIEGIGYELYCKEIERAVRELSGEAITESRAEINIDIDVSARIPSQYIEDESLRLQAYKKIAQIQTQEDSEDIIEELIDRYGEIPSVTLELIRIAEIRSASEKLGVESIAGRGTRAVISFYERNKADAFALIMAKQECGDSLVISSGANPKLNLYTRGENVATKVLAMLRAMLTPRES